MAASEKSKAHLALLATNLFFAINFTTVKYLLSEGFIKSFSLNLVRVGVCAILLWALYLFKPVKSRIEKKDLGRLFLCALAGIAINQLLFVKGLSLTYSIHASLLMLVTPILITIMAAFFLKEKLGWPKIIGLLLGVIGAIVLIVDRTTSSSASNPILGDMLIIVNAVSYTIYFILVKPLMLKYNPIVVMRMLFSIGFFLILPFCFTQFMATDFTAFTDIAWANLAIICVLGTFLAYIFNVYGIKHLGASIAGAYIYIQPILAAIIAIIFLKESLDIQKIIAGLMIAAGVYISTKKWENA